MDVFWLTLNMREAFLQYTSLNVFFKKKQQLYKQRQAELAKNQANAKQHPEAELLTNYWHSSSLLSSNILKNNRKNKYVCIHEIMQLIIMRMKTKTKIDIRKYGINRPRCRCEHKCSKLMKRYSMMMLICIKQQNLSNI